MPLSEPIPDLRSLDLLKSIAELGSIRAAASAHGISQPAASMRVRSLERALGIALIDRSSGRATITEAGVAVLQWTSEVIRSVQHLVLGVNALRSQTRSRLRVAASLTVAEYLIPSWLHRFQLLEPKISVSLTMGNSESVVRLVREGACDLGFIEGESAPRDLTSKIIMDDTLSVVVSPSHPWAKRRRPLVADDLARTRFVLREAGSGTREVLDSALAEHAITIEPMLELPSTTAIKAAVVAGAGPAILSRLATRADVESGRLIEIPVPEVSFDRRIRAIWVRARPLDAPARRFLQMTNEPRGL